MKVGFAVHRKKGKKNNMKLQTLLVFKGVFFV